MCMRQYEIVLYISSIILRPVKYDFKMETNNLSSKNAFSIRAKLEATTEKLN